MRAGQPIEDDLRAEAVTLGLDEVRFARVGPDAEIAHRLAAFLELGRHGDMTWMASTAERRGNPTRLWPQARSAILAGLSYAPAHDPLAILAEPTRGAISIYAQGKDYHEILKPKLKQLARYLTQLTNSDVKVFVDTAPLMEKPLAARAGLGWQGKHTNLVSRRHGSWLFLGAILTTAELQPDPPETDHCGRCRRCLDVCPTHAFPAPYQLDARRCIAYLTIEHKGPIARQFRRVIGNRIFGCDDCLAVCPWNKFAARAREARFAARAETDNPPLKDLLALDDETFRKRFAGTPVKRTGRDRFVRNVLIAAGNSNDPELLTPVRRCLEDASALVRGMAVWAFRQLADRAEFECERTRRLATEVDAYVRSEWLEEAGR